jgi:hypothetical protein
MVIVILMIIFFFFLPLFILFFLYPSDLFVSGTQFISDCYFRNISVLNGCNYTIGVALALSMFAEAVVINCAFSNCAASGVRVSMCLYVFLLRLLWLIALSTIVLLVVYVRVCVFVEIIVINCVHWLCYQFCWDYFAFSKCVTSGIHVFICLCVFLLRLLWLIGCYLLWKLVSGRWSHPKWCLCLLVWMCMCGCCMNEI